MAVRPDEEGEGAGLVMVEVMAGNALRRVGCRA